MSETGVPCTLRLGKEVLEGLQLNARLLSYKINKDVAYVDLIRGAIWDAYGLGEKPDLGPSSTRKDDGLDLIRRYGEFWTKEEIEAFNKTETGQMIQKCMDSNQYGEFIHLWGKLLDLWLENKSVARHVLLKRKGSNKVGSLNEIQRDVAAICWVVARRGEIPEQIVEAEHICVPPFTLGGNPVIRDSEVEAHKLLSMMSANIIAYQRELDINVLNALSAAVDARKDQTITAVDHYNEDSFTMAFAQIAQHGLVPAHIVMHPKSYVSISDKNGREFLDAPPLRVALENEEYGNISGVPIHVSSRLDFETILVTAAPHQVGVLWDCKSPTIDVFSNPNKARIGFVQQGDVGIAIINDYAIAKIVRVKAPETATRRRAFSDKIQNLCKTDDGSSTVRRDDNSDTFHPFAS